MIYYYGDKSYPCLVKIGLWGSLDLSKSCTFVHLYIGAIEGTKKILVLAYPTRFRFRRPSLLEGLQKMRYLDVVNDMIVQQNKGKVLSYCEFH